MDLNLENHKLLVVGAGGIGCELLKNLILTGFSQIEVIDLDTIELSNLNRQFLFQKCHVGKPKAIIARESVLKYNPNANIVAYHDSIMNVKYNVEYFKQFSIVLNALDNKAARSHVNRLCLAADVPLVESGSAGYLGQVTLIKKNLTECYDCLPKPPAKTFPGCTIRNTPSEPIHCIVWAKHLFNQLFGAEDPDEAVSPDGEDPENMANAGQNAIEKKSEEEPVTRVSTRQWAKDTKYDSVKLFNKLFNDDIKYLLSMSKLWEQRKAPKPLDWNESINNDSIPIQENQSGPQVSKEGENDANKLASLKIWTISECCKVFEQTVQALYKRLNESSENDENQILCWDKDDEDAMNFVASAANLRCFIFSITVKSKFEIKSLAGNIIPAIATTNAIVAGLIVLEALKVLNNKITECKTVYLRDKPIQNKLVVPGELVKPNPKCYVCASKPEISIKINLKSFTVKQFETKILKQELNMVQPDVEIDDGTGRIIISSEEGETEENNDKFLSHFGLTDQCRLKCDDFFQNYEILVVLYQCDEFDPQNTKEYEIISDSQTIKDIQTQVEKDNQKQKQLEEEALKAKATAGEDIVFETTINGTNANQEEKKRSYETAFQDDDTTVSTKAEEKNAKKLKQDGSSKNGTESIEQDDILCTSNSINDASDAISDDDDPSVQPKTTASTNGKKTIDKNVIMEEDDDILIEEDEIIIEESSNDNKSASPKEDNESSSQYNQDSADAVYYNHKKINAIRNGFNDNQNNTEDDDIIECTSEEDVIEINDDDSQSRQNGLSSDLNSNQSESSWNNNQNANQNGSNDDNIELSSNSIQEESKIDKLPKPINNHSNNENNSNNQNGQDSDDAITVIE